MIRIGVTGHQVIPQEAWPFIKKGIELLLSQHPEGVVAVSSLAAGADQYFALEVLNRGGKLHAIIPCRDYESTFSSDATRATFLKLLQDANEQELLPFDRPGEDAFLAAGRRMVEYSDLVLAVWDGEEARGKGGTADIVGFAKREGKRLHVLWPEGVQR